MHYSTIGLVFAYIALTIFCLNCLYLSRLDHPGFWSLYTLASGSWTIAVHIFAVG